jgi:Zn-dependent protease
MDETTPAPPAASHRMSPLAPLMLLAWLGLAWALDALPAPPGLLTFVFVALGWVLAVMVHEFGHAAVGYLAGDHTVADKGYLTLDPRRYADLGTTLVIPLIALAVGGIGFPGGAVYLRNDLMRSRLWRSAASLAGPLGTFLVLLGLSAVLEFWAPPPGQGQALAGALAVLAFLQATALILNLLPVPGLDGYGAIRPFMPDNVARAARPIEGLAMVGLLVLLLFVPGASALLLGAAFLMMRAMGVPSDLILDGWRAFHFWG